MKNKISKILLALIVSFAMTKDVYGAKVNLYYTYHNDNHDGNYRIHKNINGNDTFLDNIEIDDGEIKYKAFCIDVGANLQSREYISKLNQTLEQYLNSTLNNNAKSQELAKKINEYLYFGYGYNENQTTNNYYAATQKLIWDELYNAGYRQSSYSNEAYFTVGGNTIDLSNEISNIKNLISNYYKTPSFTLTSEKLEIAVGSTETYKDNNGVLSQYKVSCSEDIKCEVEGNDLKITALKKSGEQKIKFTKEGKGTGTIVYKEGNNQGVVISQGKIDPLSSEFGINTYQNVQTSGIKILLITSMAVIFGLLSYLIYYKNKILN